MRMMDLCLSGPRNVQLPDSHDGGGLKLKVDDLFLQLFVEVYDNICKKYRKYIHDRKYNKNRANAGMDIYMNAVYNI